MADSWYYDSTSGPVGPFSHEQMEALFGAATLAPSTLVRRSDADPWIPAGEAFGTVPEPPDALDTLAGEIASSHRSGTGRFEADMAPLNETDEGSGMGGEEKTNDADDATKQSSQGFAALLSTRRVLVASILAPLVSVGVWYSFLRGPEECEAVFRSDYPTGNPFYGQVLAAESEEGYVQLVRALQTGDEAFAAYIVGPGKEAGNRVLVYPAGTRAVVERISFYDRLSDPYGSKIRILEVRIEGGADDGRHVWLFRDTVEVPGCDYI